MITITRHYREPKEHALEGYLYSKEVATWMESSETDPDSAEIAAPDGNLVRAKLVTISQMAFVWDGESKITDPYAMPLRPGVENVTPDDYAAYEARAVDYLSKMRVSRGPDG